MGIHHGHVGRPSSKNTMACMHVIHHLVEMGMHHGHVGRPSSKNTMACMHVIHHLVEMGIHHGHVGRPSSKNTMACMHVMHHGHMNSPPRHHCMHACMHASWLHSQCLLVLLVRSFRTPLAPGPDRNPAQCPVTPRVNDRHWPPTDIKKYIHSSFTVSLTLL